MTVQEWLGDNQLGIDIWTKKYRYNNESFDEWLDRVSGGDEDVKRLIKEKKFLFGGRTLSNRGTGKKGSFSNCYSDGYVEDDLTDIMKTNTDIALTFKAQGGQGVSLSKLRPKGCGINHGQFASDGIVPFMEMFNRTTESISQGGSRKGALIMTLDIWHKEAEDFIKIKSEEGRIQKANLSLEIDDEFMECVKKYYETGEVITKTITRSYEGNEVTYEVTPIKLYKLMMEKAYDWAEPGCLFTNRFRNYNLMEYCDDYQIISCNPCFSGDMRLLTKDGYKTFKELDGQENIYIYNANGNISKSKVWCNGEKETVKINFANGSYIICTPDHRFMTINGQEVQAKDLKGEKVLLCNRINREVDELYVKLGFIQGDGELNRIGSNYVVVNIGKKDTDIRDLFSNDHTETVGAKEDRAVKLYGYNDYLIDNEFSQEILPNRVFPKKYNSWNKHKKSSFLCGCYSANGSVLANGGRILYKTTCKNFANQLVETLEKDFNISAYITTNKSKSVKFDNGEYICRESYDINIANTESKIIFLYEIGFYQYYKRIALENALKLGLHVYNVESYKTVPVYDFYEPETHWGIVEGCVVHNCGEQPLPKYSACNLGSINLSEFVVNSFKGTAFFDTAGFIQAVKTAIRGLDTVLDENLNNHALPEQRKMAMNYRNVGLGVMGMHDMLIKLGMKYGSHESIKFIDSLMDLMFRSAVIESSILAKEKGAFPSYNKDLLKSKILKEHFTDNEIISLEIDKYGLRNCSLLSIAPTGSLGTMLNVSTGCEPLFALYYNRKTESLNGNTEKTYKVYTGVAKEYVNKCDDKLPDYFITSTDISWKDRIDMQSVLQKHIDTAISSTVNLPNNTSQKEIEHLYLYAWEKGLKGVTIFRDGCKRAGILTTDTSKKSDDSNTSNQIQSKASDNQLKRGMIIKADDNCIGKKRTLVTGCGTLHCEAFFDPDNGELLETYLSKGSQGGCNNFMVGLSRMISLAARGGIDIYTIVDQLKSSGTCPSYAVRRATKKDTSPGSCCPVAVGNALINMYKEMKEELGVGEEPEEDDNKEYIKSKTNPQSKPHRGQRTKINPIDEAAIVPCPECGEPLTFEGGCNFCRNCGFSKCD